MRYDYKLDMAMTCIIELNGKEAHEMALWSNYTRPILNIQYKLQSTDLIKLIGDNEETSLRTVVNNQRVKIKEHIQVRLRELCRRY